MVLRPYQYHAVEVIVERVKNSEKVWLYLAYHWIRQDPDFFQDRADPYPISTCTQGSICS